MEYLSNEAIKKSDFPNIPKTIFMFGNTKWGNMINFVIIPQWYLIFLKQKQFVNKTWQSNQQIFLKMSALSDKIASETKDGSFSLQSIDKFLALMAI